MTELQVRDVWLDFASSPVLRGVNLAVQSGSLLALLGPSGCGKTTLLRAIAGFLHPRSGDISVAGRTVFSPGSEVPAHQRRIGMVPQDGALFPHLSVAKNVGFGLARKSAGRRERIAEMLDLVGLTDLARRMPAELSGGQQQRVSLARALAPAPQLILLDEPFSALDAQLRAELRADVQRVLRATQVTAILVTHDQQEALSIADQVAVMIDGQVKQCGTPLDVYRHPSTREVGLFVGDAVVLEARNSRGIASTELGDIQLSTAEQGGAGVVLLRPEQFRLDMADTGSRGRIVRVQYFGHDLVVDLELIENPATLIRVRCSDSPAAGLADELRLGQELRISQTGAGVFFPTQPGAPAPAAQ
ncbi:MAG: ABC transporter ATP-binding protein [Angustibacter sp.]